MGWGSLLAVDDRRAAVPAKLRRSLKTLLFTVVDFVIADRGGFKIEHAALTLFELAQDATIEEIAAKTEAKYSVMQSVQGETPATVLKLRRVERDGWSAEVHICVSLRKV
jgi:hypothetical protein